jgi:hypothetical protein
LLRGILFHVRARQTKPRAVPRVFPEREYIKNVLLDKFDCFLKKKTHFSFNTHQKGKYNVRDVNLLQHSYLQAQHLHISTRINQQQPASIISILRCKSAAIIVFKNATLSSTTTS